MSKARLIITAVVVEGCRPAEVATTYQVARSWVYELVARYRIEGRSRVHCTLSTTEHFTQDHPALDG